MDRARQRYMWQPYPAGVYMAGMFGLFAIIFLLAAYLDQQWWMGMFALIFGALAIFQVGEAAYTVGLRSAAWSENQRTRGINEQEEWRTRTWNRTRRRR